MIANKFIIVMTQIFFIATLVNALINKTMLKNSKLGISKLNHNLLEKIVRSQKNTQYEIPVAIAAPTAPYLGINIQFNKELITIDMIDINTLRQLFLVNGIPKFVVSLTVTNIGQNNKKGIMYMLS